jgi:very-short-patch-repair endonuclease
VESLARQIDSVAGESESRFEEDVAAALLGRGLNPVSQVGCGGFRIDLALTHPERPGEFCLGIECDGATYHSSRTARDRDRIRQSVLEDLGWRIVRVWSTDWIRSPERQLECILSAYEQVISAAETAAQSVNRAASTEIDDEDGLAPRYLREDQDARRKYDRIDDVPIEEISESACAALLRAWATNWDDLIKLVSRDLGFARTGKNIRQRLEIVLLEDIRAGSLRRIGERVTFEGGERR